MEQTKKMARIIRDALEEKKGEDVRILDISEVSVLADYFIIANGTSNNQVKALVDNVEEKMAKAGYELKQSEGNGSGTWVLLDYEDIIAFYYNNKILVKRVIAKSSDWVNIDENGSVYVNNELLEEKYIKEKVLGETDIKYPYQVPEGKYFVLGDKRDTSIDSRSSTIGTISEEDIIGKVTFRVWPFKQIGIIK